MYVDDGKIYFPNALPNPVWCFFGEACAVAGVSTHEGKIEVFAMGQDDVGVPRKFDIWDWKGWTRTQRCSGDWVGIRLWQCLGYALGDALLSRGGTQNPDCAMVLVAEAVLIVQWFQLQKQYHISQLIGVGKSGVSFQYYVSPRGRIRRRSRGMPTRRSLLRLSFCHGARALTWPASHPSGSKSIAFADDVALLITSLFLGASGAVVARFARAPLATKSLVPRAADTL